MKLPLYTIIGPPMRSNIRTFRKLCSYPFLNISNPYVCLLGMMGVILSLLDIVRIIHGGSVLPCSFWRERIQTGKVVSPECERDLKLICLVLSLEYYLLLICGIFMENPALFLPWLILYSFMIIGEFILSFFKLLIEGFCISKHKLILTMFVLYNWLTIFCEFSRLIGTCDLY